MILLGVFEHDYTASSAYFSFLLRTLKRECMKGLSEPPLPTSMDIFFTFIIFHLPNQHRNSRIAGRMRL